MLHLTHKYGFSLLSKDITGCYDAGVIIKNSSPYVLSFSQLNDAAISYNPENVHLAVLCSQR